MHLRRRRHDLERSYLPFGLEVGIELGGMDTVFLGLDSRCDVCV
jgi:lactate 2-monooxygenase